MKSPNRTVSIEVVPASREHEPVLANLLELYIHDFTEFFDVPLDANGRFGYPPLPSYWIDSNRYPFLVKVDGHLAGFVFVVKGSRISGDQNVWDVAEFFIVRGYRRLGIGKQVAHEIWRKFPGKWEVRVVDQNQPALKFWDRAISGLVGGIVEPVFFDKDEHNWQVFSFESKPVD